MDTTTETAPDIGNDPQEEIQSFTIAEWADGCADWGAPSAQADSLRATFQAPQSSLIAVGNVVEGDLMPPLAGQGMGGQSWEGGIDYPVPNCHIGSTWKSACQTDADGNPCDPTKPDDLSPYVTWKKIIPETVLTPAMCVPLFDKRNPAKMAFKDHVVDWSLARETWWQAEFLLWNSECNGLLKSCNVIVDDGEVRPIGPALDRLVLYSSLARLGGNMFLHLPRHAARLALKWGSIVWRNGRLMSADGKFRIVLGDGYIGAPDGQPGAADGVYWAAITGPTYTWASSEWGYLNVHDDPRFDNWKSEKPQHFVQRGERSVATAHLSCDVPLVAFNLTEAC